MVGSPAGPLRPAAAEIFAAVDAAGIPVVAVDIPSGIDVHTGAIDGPGGPGARTVTFGGLKPVHALADCGPVDCVDIGLDLPETDLIGLDAADIAANWPVPGPATTSTPRVSSASWPDRRPIPARPFCAPARRSLPPPAWCATADRRGGCGVALAGGRRGAQRAGGRPGTGLGGRPRTGHR